MSVENNVPLPRGESTRAHSIQLWKASVERELPIPLFFLQKNLYFFLGFFIVVLEQCLHLFVLFL